MVNYLRRGEAGPGGPARTRGSALQGTAESSVCILIVRLEPVAEGAPQHAFGGSSGATLHHIMFAVEKVRGITFVERERLETGKWLEQGGCPFPAICQHSLDTERALSGRKRINRKRVPAFVIEISVVWRRGFRPPWILMFCAFRRAVTGALPFAFSGQTLPCPGGECGRFGVAHVHRPVERQRYLIEHRPISPSTAFAFPEHWMFDAVLLLPGPAGRAPQASVAVTANFQKLEKASVGHFVSLDREGRNLHHMRIEFVVPAKISPGISEGDGARWDFNPAVLRPAVLQNRRLRLTNLSIERQLMEHIRQSFSVHQAMFDRDVQKLLRNVVPLKHLVKRLTNFVPVLLDLRHSGPILGLIRWQSSVDRIDSKSEESIQCGVASLAALKQIPIERFEVSDVEDDTMPLWNRTVVKRIGV